MAKAVKSAVKAFVVVWAVTTGAAALLGGAFASGVGITGAFLFGVSTTTLAALAGFSALLQGTISDSIGSIGQNFGTKTSTRQSAAPRQIVYGSCRVGGTIVHMETSGTDNFLLHMVIAIAGHEIEELTSIRLNDKDLTSTTSTISGSTVHTVTNTDYTNTDNDNNFGSGRLIRFTFEDGSQTAVNGFMNAQLSSMGTSDKFLGVSYVYLQMVFDNEAFGGGIPSISFKVKGKNVFDPRTNANATTDLQRSNPALIIRDYLTNTEYGLKAKTSEINDTTNAGGFSSAANTCDQNVTLADGSSTEKRYTANGFADFSTSGKNVVEGVLSSMAGRLSYVNGQFCLFAGASQTPSLTITDDELLAPISVATNTDSGDLYNTVKPVFVDSTQNFVGTDAQVHQDTTMLNADTPSGESTANYVKQMEVQLPFTVTNTMAQRLGRIALKSQRQTVTLSCLTSLKFMRLQPNDWVYVTNERLGYSQKVFEVLGTHLEPISSDEVTVLGTRLDLKEASSSVFDFATNDYTTGQSEGSDVGTGDYSVTAPSNLSLAQQTNKDGVTTKVDIKASWTNNSSDKVVLTEVAYKLSTDGAYTSDFTVGKGVSVALLPNVVVGKTYNVKARHIDVNGVASAYTSQVDITISAPSDAPAAPTSLSASTGKPLNIVVSWTNSTSADLKATKIYRRTSNTTPTDDTHLVDTIYGANGKKTSSVFGVQDGLDAGTTYFFWVRSVNHSDVHSAFVGSASGNFTKVEADDVNLPDFSGYFHFETNNTNALSDSAFNTQFGRNPLNDDILIVVNTSASPKVSKAYKYDTSQNPDAFVEISNFTTGDLVVDGTIAGAKIVAGDITATQIETGTLTSASGVFGAISANDISTGTLNAANVTISGGDVTINNSGIAINGSSSSINLGSGAFTVSSSGVLSATGATISGSITATSLNVTNATVTGTLDASVITLNNEPLNNVLTFSEVGGVGLLTLNEAASIDGDFVVAGNFEATGLQPDLIIGKVTGVSGDTVQADAILRSSTGSGAFKIQAGTSNTTKVSLGYDALAKTTLSADGQLAINTDGSLALTLNSSQNAVFTGDIQTDSLGVGTAASGTTGEIRATNNVTAFFSDERLKDFKGKIENPIDKIMNINGYYFKENSVAKDLGYSNNRLQVGLNAQEVEKVLPEVVTEAPIDNKYKTIWYEKLIPLLVEGVKEQQKVIKYLQEQINDISK
tara:strand:- start:803 stop:4432 length:3630 start_codon:yes stop_codon:yes gene_type:complete